MIRWIACWAWSQESSTSWVQIYPHLHLLAVWPWARHLALFTSVSSSVKWVGERNGKLLQCLVKKTPNGLTKSQTQLKNEWTTKLRWIMACPSLPQSKGMKLNLNSDHNYFQIFYLADNLQLTVKVFLRSEGIWNISSGKQRIPISSCVNSKK